MAIPLKLKSKTMKGKFSSSIFLLEIDDYHSFELYFTVNVCEDRRTFLLVIGNRRENMHQSQDMVFDQMND